MENKEFVNGFDSWIETYSEMSRLVRESINNENTLIKPLYVKNGYGLIYELSKELTDKFEEAYNGKIWDGDWFDTVEEYFNNRFN